MKTPHIEIKQRGMKTEVFINGNKVDGVRKVGFEHDCSHKPVLHLELLATDMAVDCMRVPELPDVSKPFYVLRSESI